MIRINVSRADATLTETETLTEGRVGLRCAFTFGEEWNGLQKIAYFEGSDARSVAMVDGDEVEVPWECLASAGYKLNVGVRGDNASGDTVIPTVWVRAGKIVPSPDSGIPEGEEPTPSVVAQIQQAAANALLISKNVAEQAESGAFKGDKGDTGEQGPQGETGDPGVYIGTTPPTDPDVTVWIDPNGPSYTPGAIDEELSSTSENPVQNKVVTAALATKADQASVEATIPPIVNTWLDNNIAQETGYALDASLTMSNAAAPADKVGELKNIILTEENIDASWEIGSINGATGSNAGIDYTNRLRTDYTDISEFDIVTISVDAGYQLVWSLLNEAKGVLFGQDSWHGSGIGTTFSRSDYPGMYYVRLAFCRNNQSDFTDTSDSSHVKIIGSAINASGVATEKQHIIENNLTSIETAVNSAIIYKENFFNPATAVVGQYCSGTVGGGITSAANASYAYNVIPVQFGETYVISKSNYAWFEFDENMVGVTRLGNQTERINFEYTPSKSTVKYVAFSWTFASLAPSDFMVTKVGVDRASYIKYPSSTSLTEEVIESLGLEGDEVYTVGPNEAYTSFTACLSDLKNNTRNKVIYVKSGTYDIFQELGGKTHMQDVDPNAGWRAAQEVIPQNTKIIGVGDVTLIFTPSDEDIIDYDRGWLMSALNISGSCEVENISIDASNCRYAIHIESNGAADDANNATIVLKNVRVKRSPTGIMGSHQVIGTGIGHNAKWTFQNCHITGDSNSAGFSVHTNAPSASTSATVVLENCVFDTLDGQNTSKALVQFISQYLPTSTTNFAYLNNCFVRGKIATITTITNRQAFAISVIGGSSNGIENSSDMTSGYTIGNYGNTQIQ